MIKLTLAYCLTLLLALASSYAQATLSCSSSTTGVTGTYSTSSTTTLTGTISISCSRASGDSSNQTIYMGIDNGLNNRKVTQQTGSNTLTYQIYRNGPSSLSGTWTTGPGVVPGNTSNSHGLQFTLSFGSSLSASTTVNYYLSLTSGQNKPAGIYDDTGIGVTVRSSSSTGTVLSTSTIIANISILSSCRFSTTPSALNISYTAFSASVQTGTTSFDVSCTYTTPYTLGLDATSGTIVGINYTLSLSPTASPGTGFPQTYTVTGSAVAGQAGTCTTGTCSSSATRTITITY